MSFRFAPVRTDFAVLVATAAARAAASVTAAAQARLDVAAARTRFDPADGCFDARTARSLGEWKEG